MLRVVSLAGTDALDGAGIAASRLHAALRARGVDSTLLVRHRAGDGDPGVEELRRTRLGRWTLFHLQRIERRTGYLHLLHPASPGAPFEARLEDAHVLHVHNFHAGIATPAALARWSRRLPVVWTLHDLWAATGKCIFPEGCERWTTGCGSCPQLGEWPHADRDRTAFLWRWKRRLWSTAAFHIVTPSRWLAEQVARSPLLRGHPVDVLPNAIDTGVFRPGDRDSALRELGIAGGVGVVAFGSHPAAPRKGFVDLLDATADARAAGRVVVLAMGEPLADQPPGVVWTGTLAPGAAVARRLAAADLVCLPTRADNLPLVLLEAAATGLPAVAYDVGGVGEAVLDGRTGLLVPAGDRTGLRSAIDALLGDPARRAAFGRAARELAEREWAADVVAARHEALYRRILPQRAPPNTARAR